MLGGAIEVKSLKSLKKMTAGISLRGEDAGWGQEEGIIVDLQCPVDLESSRRHTSGLVGGEMFLERSLGRRIHS